jgi:hypothetical protein
LRQCREGVGLSTERWYGGDGMKCDGGGLSIPGSKPGFGNGSRWYGCGSDVKT